MTVVASWERTPFLSETFSSLPASGGKLSPVAYSISGREARVLGHPMCHTPHRHLHCSGLCEKCTQMSVCDWVNRMTSSLRCVKDCRGGKRECRWEYHMPHALAQRGTWSSPSGVHCLSDRAGFLALTMNCRVARQREWPSQKTFGRGHSPYSGLRGFGRCLMS